MGISSFRALGLVLNFLLSVLFVRLLTRSEFGKYSYILELVTIAATIASLALPTVATRDIAAAPKDKKKERLITIIPWISHATFFSAILTSLLAYFLGRLFIHDPAMLALFITALPIIILNALTGIGNAIFLGLKKIELSMISKTIIQPAFMIMCGIIGYKLLHLSFNAQSVLTLRIVSYLLILIFIVVFFLRITPFDLKILFRKTVRPISFKKHVPFLYLLLISIINQKLSLIVLGAYQPFSDVAIFKVALTLSSLISFFLLSAQTVMTPHIAEYYGKKNKRMINKIAIKTIRPIFFISLILFAVYAIFGRTLLVKIYKPFYAAAYLPLLILSVGHVFNVLTGALGTVLTNTGNQKFAFAGALSGCITKIILLFILVPRIGVIGAAIAFASGIIISNAVSFFLLHSYTDYSTSIFGSDE